jgi:hypothetical protein
MKGDKIFERKARAARLDVRFDGEFKVREVSLEAKKAECLTNFLDGDHAIAILVEKIKDAAEAKEIETGATETKGGASLVTSEGCCCFHGLFYIFLGCFYCSNRNLKA